MIAISTVLLYFIFHYRIVLEPSWPELSLKNTTAIHEPVRNFTSAWRSVRRGGRAAYHVAYNPSTITTIAAWTGRVIPYLSSSIMALVAFFAARHMVQKSKLQERSELPPPEQLTLLVENLDGNGIFALWNTVKFRYGRNRERLSSPLPAAFAALTLITITG